MTDRSRKILFWSPRLLCMMFIVFISLFALDVFNEDRPLWEVLLGLMIHMIPTAIIIFLLIFTWKREWIAALVFFLLATFYIITTHWSQHWASYLSISGTMYVMGILYLLNWIFRKNLRQR